MTPRELQQSILESDLLPSEKLVGLIIAFHLNSKTGSTRLFRRTLVDESGLSLPSVKRAVKALAKMRLISKKSTGRSSMFSLVCSGNNTGTVEGSPVDHQKVHDEPLSKRFKDDLDTEFSTPIEEKNKREEARIRREKSDDIGLFEV